MFWPPPEQDLADSGRVRFFFNDKPQYGGGRGIGSHYIYHIIILHRGESKMYGNDQVGVVGTISGDYRELKHNGKLNSHSEDQLFSFRGGV